MTMGFQNHHLLPAAPAWNYGSKTTRWEPVPSPGVKGTLQEFMPTSDLEKVDLHTTDLVVGEDNHLYAPRFGLIEGLAVKEPTTDEAHVYVDRIDWESYPPIEELAYLFDIFFKEFDREVLMLVGKKRDYSDCWLYHVPQQIGSPGHVEWTADDEEMGMFTDVAKWIGTIHIHPGADCTPSQTDIDDWAEPEKSGLHLIFGRNGSFAIYGSIAGSTFKVYGGHLTENVERSEVPYTTSRGRSLEVLLAKPKPKPKPEPQKATVCPLSDFGLDWEVLTSRSSVGEEKSYVERNLHIMRISPINHDELQSLQMVFHGGRYYILTRAQYTTLGELCSDVCPIPMAGNLSIRSIKDQKEGEYPNVHIDCDQR